MRLLPLFLLAFLSARSAPALLHGPAAEDPFGVHAWRLDNGLEVRLSVNRELPQFHAEIVVKAGSKNDPADCTGLAHYLEHLLFKGSTRLGTVDYAREKPLLDRITALYESHFTATGAVRRAEIYAEINRVAGEASAFAIPNEFDTLYQALGATDVNAHTSVEETVYKATFPANRLRAWATVEADRFASPVFRLFHTELETVYEEKNRSLDSKYSLLYEAADRLLFPVHPYGQQTTLGEAEHLKRPSLVRIQEFFDRWYVPSNMVVCLSGDLDPQETLRTLDATLGTWPARPAPATPTWQDKGPDGPRRVDIPYPGEETVLISWRTVPAGHADEDALAMLDMLLDNRVAGLINLNLVQAQKLNEAGSYPQFMRDAGVHRLWGSPKDGQSLDEVEALLLGEIERVKRGEFDAALLPAIIADLRRDQARTLESNEARVTAMRDAAVLDQPWSRVTGRLARLARVTPQDIVRVARAHFGETRVTARVVDGKRDVPAIAKPAIDAVPIPEGRRSAFAASVLGMPVAEANPRFLKPSVDYTVTVTNGVSLIHHPNPVNDLFSLDLVLSWGEAFASTLPLALRLAEKSGAGDISAAAVAREWYRLGAEWSYEIDANKTVIHLTGLEDQLEPALTLVMKQLGHSLVEPGAWEALRGIVRQERADMKKDPEQIFAALAEYQQYGGSSYRRATPLKELESMSAAQLLSSLNLALRWPKYAEFTGKTPPDKLQRLLSAAGLKPEVIGSPCSLVLRSRIPATNEVWWVRQETAQTSLRILIADGQADESRVPAAQVFNPYFGNGMASLVFQEVREARALAYSAWGAHIGANSLREDNVFTAELGTQCDKTIEALDTLLGLMRRMPVQPDRFARAKDGVLSRYRNHPLPFRDVPSAVRRWIDLGLGGDPRPARLAAVEALTLEDMTKFARDLMATRPVMIALVGDPAKFDPKALEKFGSVRELRVDELFAP